MVLEEGLNGAIAGNGMDILTSLPGISLIVKLAQVAFVVVIVYIAFLILKGVLGIKHQATLKKILIQIERVNNKLDKMIKLGKKGKK